MTAIEARSTGLGPVALICGTGRLPELLAEKLELAGLAPLIIDLQHSSDRWADSFRVIDVPVTKPGKIVQSLRAAQVRTLCFAGGISARPKLTGFGFDWAFIKYFWQIARAMWKGDDGLLGTVIRLFEKEGFQVIGAHEIMPELLASEGNLTSTGPDIHQEKEISLAIEAAHRIGAKDIGQAAVARGSKVVALEDRFGTAYMLKNLSLSKDTEFPRGGVLAKVSKPGQELRVDLPSIGPDTIDQVFKAGLAGIVVEANRSLLIDRAKLLHRAEELDIFVCARQVLDNG